MSEQSVSVSADTERGKNGYQYWPQKTTWMHPYTKANTHVITCYFSLSAFPCTQYSGHTVSQYHCKDLIQDMVFIRGVPDTEYSERSHGY